MDTHGGEVERKQVWITSSVHKELKMMAFWTGREIQELATEAIEDYLDRNHDRAMYQQPDLVDNDG